MSACNAGDRGSIPESGRSPGKGNSNPFQYSCLDNPMDGGAWEAAVHGVTKSRTRLTDFTLWLGHSEQSGELQEMEIEKLESDSARPGRITKGTKFQSKCNEKPLRHLQWRIQSLPNESESL